VSYFKNNVQVGTAGSYHLCNDWFIKGANRPGKPYDVITEQLSFNYTKNVQDE